MKQLQFFATIACLLSLLPAFAQHAKAPMNPQLQKAGSATKSAEFQAQFVGEIHTPSADLKWKPILSHRAIEHEAENEEVERIKEQKALLKLQVERETQPATEPQTTTVSPIIGTNFLGNTNDGSSPMDNSIAISNGGYIVSVANATIEFDDENGNNLYYNDILTFIGDPNITGVCDPVVLYDSKDDRFIFFCQVCPIHSSDSKLLICFSKTNNPANGWWYYKITGNPLNDGSGFDYPKLGISNNELYVGGNLYFDNGNYNQSVVYQIEKTGGYSGAGSLTWQYWYNLTGFTICPLSWGQQGGYGPGIYMVSSKSGGDNKVYFYDLTDDLSASAEQLNWYSVATTAYSPAGNANQGGTGVQLDNGDCRMLSGFFLNGTAHFAFHSDFQSGYTGINYNRMTVGGTLTNVSSVLGLSGYDYAYPSVVSFATTPSDKSVMVGFLRSGSSIYPEIRVANCDDAMNWSGSTLVRQGDGYVSYTGSPERWGDYTGTSRRHNSSSPSIWLNGMFGTTANNWNAWVAEVHGINVGVESPLLAQSMQVSPNPVLVENYSLSFDLAEKKDHITIELMDNTGKMVQHLYEGRAYLGKNTFSFNKAQLSAGTYYLLISADTHIIANEKIVILN